MDFTELFVDVDDFWQAFGPAYRSRLVADRCRRRQRDGQLSISEIMTILIGFQSSGFRDFKRFYAYLRQYHSGDFPDLVSYSRFVTLMPRAAVPLFVYMMMCCRGTVTGISFIDSTAIRVCGNKRIGRHRVFEGYATRGKTTMGWFYGFKLHIVINDPPGSVANCWPSR